MSDPIRAYKELCKQLEAEERAEVLRTGLPYRCGCGTELIVNITGGAYCPKCRMAHPREIAVLPPRREVRSAN